MPAVGDLKSSEKKDIRQRVKAIQALLAWKETKSVEMRQSHNEKIRKITIERDKLKEKCKELEQALKGYSPKDTVKPKVGHSAISQAQYKKSQADLRRAEAENETLRNQLQKAQL